MAQTSEAVAESSRKIVQSAAESAQRLATAPLSSGSQFWDAMFGMWGVPQSRSVATPARPDVQQSSRAEEVIPLAEETLIVGKHTVNSGTTTVRRYVVESPVEQRVELYDEKVVVERRKPVTDAVTGETLTEVTVEMIETSEVPLVAKDVKVREEVVVRRERTRRVETVRDTVRRDEIEVERSERARARRQEAACARRQPQVRASRPVGARIAVGQLPTAIRGRAPRGRLSPLQKLRVRPPSEISGRACSGQAALAHVPRDLQDNRLAVRSEPPGGEGPLVPDLLDGRAKQVRTVGRLSPASRQALTKRNSIRSRKLSSSVSSSLA